MRRVLAVWIVWQCAAALAFAQSAAGGVNPGHLPVLSPHFEPELLLDSPIDPEDWARQSHGLHAAFGSTDRIYARREVPGTDNSAVSWTDAGWRGERLNALILVWSPDALEQVRLETSNLTDGRGHLLRRDALRLQIVRYVLSNHPANARNTSCDAGTTEAAWLLPDRLDVLDRFDLPARSVRPVWLSLEIPAAAAVGTYAGTIAVKSGEASITLRVTVRVQPPVLPPPADWQFRLDLWQNPWVIAWHYGVQPWSEEHRALLKQHLRLYADAGGKYITTYAVHSPWQDSSYMIEGGMIDWIRRNDGNWAFDYRVFDEYVAMAMDAGVTGAITIYTPVPWGNRFRYWTSAPALWSSPPWPPDSSMFRLVWRAFLDDLKQHLEQRGWLGRTYLGINENPLDQTLAAIKVIKEHSSQWRITYAGDWHPELSGLLDDYSSVYGKEPEAADIQARSVKGLNTTFYVCCTPPKPNTFVFSPPVEGRWLGWYAAARGYNGFLRWAYERLAGGPGPRREARAVARRGYVSRIPGRREQHPVQKLREGIVDFEKSGSEEPVPSRRATER